jgi:ATP synthase protein I
MSAGSEGENLVWGLISTLVAGPAVWGGIGFGVDRLTDSGVFTPIGLVIGFVTSFYVVYVKTNPPVKIDSGDDAPS